MDIWVVGTSNQLFLRDAKTETNFPKKGFTGKTPLFVIGLFCSRHSTLASDRAVLIGNDMLSILVVSTKKPYSSFLEKVFVLQKI